MRLVIDVREGWDERATPDGGYELVLPAASDAGGPAAPPAVRLRAGGLIRRPDNMPAWASQLARRNVPEGAEIEVLREVGDKTDIEWPVHYVELQLLRASTNGGGAAEPFEIRIHAFYSFLDYAAHAVAIATPEAFAEHASVVRELLATARPDMWRDDEVVALYELWQ